MGGPPFADEAGAFRRAGAGSNTLESVCCGFVHRRRYRENAGTETVTRQIDEQMERARGLEEPCSAGIPSSRQLRERVRRAAEAHVAEHALRPPMTMVEISEHVEPVRSAAGVGPEYAGFIAVMLGNATWRETVARVPFGRRVLLLPQCLRGRETCPAEVDDVGLLCQSCGRCPIGLLQQEAEERGYVVLVAEGTTVVTTLLETGKVDAVIGVGCLEALERSFPAVAGNAIPGIAIPLLRDGCDATGVDVDWVLDAIHLSRTDTWRGCPDVDSMRARVAAWFEEQALERVLHWEGGQTDRIALTWLKGEGKRWRPLLLAAVYQAITGEEGTDATRELAVAVECFHKASLIHDDIEDRDPVRYGAPTLHVQHGVPVALNAGDFLLGEGYRLIARCCAAPEQAVRMLAIAAEGHRDLCLGQGEELCWVAAPQPLTADAVLRIFRRKTAPAFEVALRLGAVAAGTNGDLCGALHDFSQALGVAYQIRDDLEDFGDDAEAPDDVAMRPSLLLALAYEGAQEGTKRRIEHAWRAGDCREAARLLRECLGDSGAVPRARQLLDDHRDEALAALRVIDSLELRVLLHRVTWRILGGNQARP